MTLLLLSMLLCILLLMLLWIVLLLMLLWIVLLLTLMLCENCYCCGYFCCECVVIVVKSKEPLGWSGGCC